MRDGGACIRRSYLWGNALVLACAHAFLFVAAAYAGVGRLFAGGLDFCDSDKILGPESTAHEPGIGRRFHALSWLFVEEPAGGHYLGIRILRRDRHAAVCHWGGHGKCVCAFIRNQSRAWRSRRSDEHTSELQSLMRISYPVV